MQAVLEAARNVACAGGQPLAITNCLNFGNPEKPEVAWELTEAIEGMALACEALGVPVVSGNVSLYNETDGRAIDPTPVVGCVGLVEDVRAMPSRWNEGDVVLLAGGTPRCARRLRVPGALPRRRRRPAAASPISPRGGAHRLPLAGRAAPDARARRLGRRARGRARRAGALRRGSAPTCDLGEDVLDWFGEGAGRAVVACRPEDVPRLGGVPLGDLGRVGGDSLLGVPLDELRRGLRGRPRLMCGIFGIHAPERDVARLAYFGLFALQHRGQESAGIAVSDDGTADRPARHGPRLPGLLREELQGLHGQAAIAHCRYSTTGSVNWTNAQPVVHARPGAHGRARPQREPHEHERRCARSSTRRACKLRTTSDTEVIAALLAHDERPLEEAVAATMNRLEGAYAIVVLSEGKLLGFRDPHGIRPLVIGRLEDD